MSVTTFETELDASAFVGGGGIIVFDAKAAIRLDAPDDGVSSTAAAANIANPPTASAALRSADARVTRSPSS